MTRSTRVQVHVVEATDDAGLRTFWEIERASVTDTDPDAPHRTFEALRATRDAWGAGEDGVHLIARDDRGDVAGVAEMCWPLDDNEHLVEADIAGHDHLAAGRGTAARAWAACCGRPSSSAPAPWGARPSPSRSSPRSTT